jgi:hypothetical protein
MSLRNRVAKGARRTAVAIGLVILVTAANPSAVAEPFGSNRAAPEWRLPWTLFWNWIAGLPFGAPETPALDFASQADETPPPPPPPPPPDLQQGVGTSGGAGSQSDPDGQN